MKKIAVLTLCLVGAAIADPTSVVAQCTTGTAHYSTNANYLLGDIPGGTTVHYGQQFTVDCTAQLVDVTFRLTLDSGLSSGSQTCLATGDTLSCVLMDVSHNELARVDKVLNYSNGTRDVTFDFSGLTYGLDAGDYVVTLENVTKAFAFFAKFDDNHAGWLHVSTDGVWTEEWFSDAYFSVNWDENGVPADQLTWGALKADFR